MSLILAVEPDRRQATQLASLVRQHIRGELVVADSGAAALAALAGRIPDLILTPALLPPKDEAVLTSWLRDLGDAAAHVQTLAIPILAETDTKGREQSSSIFGRLREQPAAQNQGCDPEVFAEQVRVYLDRAGVERSNRSQPGIPAKEPLMAAAEESSPEDDFDETVTFDDLVFDPNPAAQPTPAPAPVPVPEPPAVMKAATPIPVPEPPAVLKAPTPFARPEKRVESATLRSWESELGLEATPATAPPLWRVDEAHTTDAVATGNGQRQNLAKASFDPENARYAPLFRRLDELSAQHA